MRINHNIGAMGTINDLSKANHKSTKNTKRLSSGLRINSTADDAAGMAITSKMSSQIRGLQQANRNAMDGISMIQTAEGALDETHAILGRMRELAVQSANGTYTDKDRAVIQEEIGELIDEITRIGETTEFNTKPLLNGGESSVPLLQYNQTIASDGIPGQYLGEIHLKIPITPEDMVNLAGQSITLEGKDFVFTNHTTEPLEPGQVGINLDSILTASGERADYSEQLYRVLGREMERHTTIDVTRHYTTGDSVGNKLTFKATSSTPPSDGPIIEGNMEDGLGGFKFQVGANEGQTVQVEIGDMRAAALGLIGMPRQPGYTGSYDVEGGAALSVMNQKDAEGALLVIDRAIDTVSKQRAVIGATQNRLEHTVNHLNESDANLTNARSRIEDADMAKEMMDYTSQNIISQAATSMLAQANQAPQQVLELLKD